MPLLQISAKNLGILATTDACPRCCWLQMQMSFKMPFQIFPGIFSSIDSYTKRYVEACFARQAIPDWLSPLGHLAASLPTPHFTKFNTLFDEENIRLTGALDALFQLRDGTLCVADYKTAKFTGAQDKLLPMYKVQLNGYAVIAERTGLGKVSKLGLVYFQPRTEADDIADQRNERSDGFAMGFSAHVLELELKPDVWLYPFVKRARQLMELTSPPRGGEACENCHKVTSLLSLFS